MSINTLAPPRQGWIRGRANGAELDLDFNRVQHTVTGTANDDTVQLSIDHDRGQVEGRANGYAVSLEMDWNPGDVHLQGFANGRPLRLDVDYNRNTVSGHNGLDQWNLRFDQDSLQGTMGEKTVDLELDTSSGQLTGTVDGMPVSAEMINLDMGDVATNLFLFARP